MSETPPPIPPPVATPPPPGPPQWPTGLTRKPFPWLAVILGVVGLMVAVGVVGVLSIKSWYESQSTKEIKKPHLAGNPTVKKSIKPDWFTVTFPEVPLTLDLPDEPHFVPTRTADFPQEARFIMDQYAEYEAHDELANIYLHFNWMTGLGKLTISDSSGLDEFAKEYIASQAKGDPTPLDLASKPAGSVAFSFSYIPEDETELYKAHYLFVPWKEGVLIFGVHPTKAEDGLRILEHMAATATVKGS